MDLNLIVWRQRDASSHGGFENYRARDISPDISFLEMLDIINEDLTRQGKEPISFDHDCREGICGTCSQMINGVAHGPQDETTVCQLHMRHFRDGETIYIEPWRSRAFPVIRDLIVNRSALDRIIEAGGYISVSTGGVPDANAIPVSRDEAEKSMDAAACIGCGACVAGCPNGSAMLFNGAKVSHLSHLPQGRIERRKRVLAMIEEMDHQGFGNCTNHYECQAVCPKSIHTSNIARMNREYMRAIWRRRL